LKSTASKHRFDMIDPALKPEIVLSESNRKACIEKFKSIRVPKLHNVQTEAAVLIPLCLYKGELGFLYTLRSMKLTSNRGQVSYIFYICKYFESRALVCVCEYRF